MKDKITIVFIIIFILLVIFQATYTIFFLMQLFSDEVVTTFQVKPEKAITGAPFYLVNENEIAFDIECEISGTDIKKKGLILSPQYQFNLNISVFNEKGDSIETARRLISTETDNTQKIEKDNIKYINDKHFDIIIKRRLLKHLLEKERYYYLNLSIQKDARFTSTIQSGRILIKENIAKPDVLLFDIVSFINALFLIVLFFVIFTRLKKIL